MRNKQTHRPGGQPDRHGARSEFEAMRENSSLEAPRYPRGYSESQGGASPRYGAERGSVDDAYPHASSQWQREDLSQSHSQSYARDPDSEPRGYEQIRGASAYDPYAPRSQYEQPFAGGSAPWSSQERGGSWQEPGARRMGQGYGDSSGYAQRMGYGYGHAGIDERPISYGYQQGFQSRERFDQQGDSGQPRQAVYQGRGPRNYTRSNERILEEVNERLTDDPWLDASDITVRCVDGRVQLEGEVRDRWMKHRAEDIVDACMGVRDIENRLRIRSSGASVPGTRTDVGSSDVADTTRGQGMGTSQASQPQGNRPAH